MKSIPEVLARPVNRNKPPKVTVPTPKGKLPQWLKNYLKDKVDSLGERYYIYGEDIKFPKFVSPIEREWFQYYWSLQWGRR